MQLILCKDTASRVKNNQARLKLSPQHNQQHIHSLFRNNNETYRTILFNGEWEYFEIDLSAYDGQEIYVALRHHAHNGMAAMFDDFTLSNFYEL